MRQYLRRDGFDHPTDVGGSRRSCRGDDAVHREMAERGSKREEPTPDEAQYAVRSAHSEARRSRAIERATYGSRASSRAWAGRAGHAIRTLRATSRGHDDRGGPLARARHRRQRRHLLDHRQPLLLKPLPVHEPDRLVQLAEAGKDDDISVSYAVWKEIRDRNVVSDAFASAPDRVTVIDGGDAAAWSALWASGRFFETLGVPAIAGRMFGDSDDRRGGGPDGPVVVISDRIWQRRYGRSPAAIGQTLTLDRVPFVIVGVAPPEFFGLDVGYAFDVILPLETEPLLGRLPPRLDSRTWPWLRITAWLRRASMRISWPRPFGGYSRRSGWRRCLTTPIRRIAADTCAPPGRCDRRRPAAVRCEAATRRRCSRYSRRRRWCCWSRARISRTCCSRGSRRGDTS